jgi:cyclic beta-1,2-glucan synthetase
LRPAEFLRSVGSTTGWRRQPTEFWQDKAPIRAELFGTERLEHHAESLASAQSVASGEPPRVAGLNRRVQENAEVLLDAYRVCAKAVQDGQPIAPAAEWLLDNFHLVEQQLRQIADDLPPGYYRQLPKLIEGPFAGYPRVFGLAWAYVAHTDSLLSGQILRRYVTAYQRVQPLKIGELWAVAITLRIVLIENMRRLAVQIIEGHTLRQTADKIVDDALLVGAKAGQSRLFAFQKAIAPYEDLPLSETVAAQIAKRLRGYDPAEMPLLNWLEDRLNQQGRTIDDVVTTAQLRMGASNVSMRNIVTSMRLLSDMDWAEFFEDVSLVDARFGEDSTFAEMDFATRNRYRTEIEILARGSGHSELAVTDTCLRLAREAADQRDRDPGQWLIGRCRPALEGDAILPDITRQTPAPLAGPPCLARLPVRHRACCNCISGHGPCVGPRGTRRPSGDTFSGNHRVGGCGRGSDSRHQHRRDTYRSSTSTACSGPFKGHSGRTSHACGRAGASERCHCPHASYRATGGPPPVERRWCAALRALVRFRRRRCRRS